VKEYKEVLDRLDEIETELAEWLGGPLATTSAPDEALSAYASALGTSAPTVSEQAPAKVQTP